MLPGCLLLLLLQETPPPSPVPPPRPAQAQALAQASVLRVHSPREGLRVNQGSGVVIAPGLVATNAHVAEASQGLTVQQGATVWPVLRVRMDRSRDLCLLTVPGLTVPPVALAPEPTAPGQPVLVVGYPGGRGPTVAHGRLRGIWHYGDSRLYQSDAVVLPGNSGGGLFDEQGRLLGLTTLTFTPSPRLNFSLPVAWIQELAKQPPGWQGPASGWNLGEGGADLLSKLATDPRNHPAWEEAARQWVLELPQDENAWLALGLALDRSARAGAEAGHATTRTLPEGVEAYQRSLALREAPKTWNNLGVSLDLLNRFEEAERAFQAALAMEPGYGLAWLNLGCARMNARRFPEAVQAFERGLALRPDEADAWVRFAACQRLARQGEAALASLRIALRYRPLVAELWLDVGLLLVELARLDEARDVHARLVAMHPETAARLQAFLKRAEAVRPAQPRR